MTIKLENIIHKYNSEELLILVRQAFLAINNNFLELDENQLKILYKGFYAGYRVLMSDPKISKEVKIDLVAKKEIIDNKYNNKKIIKNRPLNELNVFKSVANRIQTENLKNL